MKASLRKLVLAVLALALVSVAPAYAQVTSGAVSGTVVDSTGAVIPGATVTLTGEGTGVTREQQTNAAGGFLFDRVRNGSYTLTITMQGFRTFRSTGVEVSVGKVSALGSLALEVGSQVETVEVEVGALPLMQAESPEIVGRYEARKVADLTWGTFGLDAIAFLTPGVVPSFGNINTNTTGFGSQIGGDTGAVPAAAGQRGRSTQFNMDGHEINDITIGGPSIFLDNLDTVAEYQVSTTQFDASQGRLPGAQVNVTTKSGTNEVHGSVFYFYQANSLRAKESVESRFDLEKPKTIKQTYGFTAGGPIIKNKWFGFGSYERFKIPGGEAETSSGTFALTSAGATNLAGAFPGNNAVGLYASRGPFSISDGNPTCASAPVMIDFSSAGGPSAVEACEVARTVPDSETLFEYTLRMDVQLERQSFSGRWFDQNDPSCCFGSSPFSGTSGYWVAIPARTQSLSLAHTFQFTPRVLNDFHFSYGRFIVGFEGANTEPVGNIRANLARMDFFPLSSSRHGVSGTLHSFGLQTNLPQGRLLYNFQFSNTVSMVTGRHTIKAGLEFRRNRTTAPFLPSVNGRFNFTSQACPTGNAAVDALCSGGPGVGTAFGDSIWFANLPTATFTEGPIAFQPFETDQFYFIQDDFRLRPNLTINAGLRYEHTGQPINTAHEFQLARESGADAFWLQSLPLDQRVFPKIDSDENNWAPRIGFAYTPRFWPTVFGDDKTVIRGGYSVAYEAAFYNILLNVTTSAPQVFSFSVPGFPVPGGATGSEVASSIPTPRNTFDPRDQNRTTVADNFISPYAQYWTLGFQREFRSNVVAELRYVGNRAISQFQSAIANPRFSRLAASFPELIPAGLTPCPAGATPPTFNFTSEGRVRCDARRITERNNSARSSHHSLQARVDVRNLLDQITGGIGFTWGKTIDNASEIFGFNSSGGSPTSFPQNPFDLVAGERGLSNHHLGRTFQAHWIWDSPWYRDQQGALGKVAGGWQWNGQVFLYDGRPWTALQGSGSPRNTFCTEDIPQQFRCRPYLADFSAPMNTIGDIGTPNVRWWNNNPTACNLTSCPLGPFGAGRGLAFGDGTVLANMGFFKNTRVGPEGRYNVQFRTMVVNVFNHRNFGPPASSVTTSSNFGRPNRQNVAGRIVRFALRFTF